MKNKPLMLCGILAPVVCVVTVIGGGASFEEEDLMWEERRNTVVGLFLPAAFLFSGFVLLYLRDFTPGKESWIASASKANS